MMGDYYVDPEQIDKESAFTLVEAAARYMTAELYPNTDVLCAILGIEKEDE